MDLYRIDDEPTPLPGREKSARHVVRLNTLMLLIAVIAVCLGVLREIPGLGIVLIILVLPALLRTFLGAARSQAQGHTMSVAEKTLAFLGSLGVVTVIGLASSITFVATCVPAGLAMMSTGSVGAGLVVACLAGLAVAGTVFYHVGRYLWPQKGP